MEPPWKGLGVRMKPGDLEKFKNNVNNLFSHLYEMGWNAANIEDYTIDRLELMETLNKSYLDDKWAEDVSSKRKEFLDLCWRVLYWGWLEGNK